MANKPKNYLKNVNFDFEKGDNVDYNPHIAYTLGTGAASRHNDAYLLKSLEDHDILSTVFVMKSNGFEVPEDVLKKAQASSNNLRNMLQDVIRNNYGEDTWIADFNDKVVVFMDSGVYYAQSYKHRRGSYNLVDERANVIRCEYFQLDPNNTVEDEIKQSLLSGSDIIIKSEELELELGQIAELLEVDLLKAKMKKEDDEEDDEEQEEQEENDAEEDGDRDEEEDSDDDPEEDEDDEEDEEVLRYLKKLKTYKRDDEVVKEGEPKKTVDGKKYPAKDFAYTPDKSKPSTWKMPLFDKNHARLAHQALTSGIYGNKVQIPQKDLAAVKRKVAAANKKFGNKIEKSASDLGVAENQNPETGAYKVEQVDITKSVEFIELQKKFEAMEKAAEAKDAQLQALQKAETQRLTKSYTEIVKSDVLSDELQQELVFKMLEGEETAALIHSVVKAFKDKIADVEEHFATKEFGSDQLQKEAENDPVAINKAARLEALKAELEKQA